jgi:autotransporter translocation and assembly factor TamB
VKNFTYRDTAIIVKNLKSDFIFNNEYTSTISGVNIKLNTSADSLQFGNSRFDSVLIKYNMQGPDADISLHAGMDTSTNAALNGKLNFGSGRINADLDTVYIDYGGYQVENSGNWIFSLEQADRVKFEKFDIKSRNAIINVNGEFSLNNESDLRIEGNDLKITDIADIINKADSSYILSAENDIEGELSTFFINFKGTFDAPILTSEIKTNTMKYKDTDIGVITAKMNYENEVADANISMNNAEGKGNLTIKGTIPFRNPLSGDTTAIDISSAPVDINFKANDFLLDYFSVLISDAASLRGVMNADLSAKGTSSDPVLTGNLKITNGGYLLPLTGMYYNFNVDMSTDNFKLVVNKFRIYNEDDEEAGYMDLVGDLDFKDLKVKDINLEMHGEMVLLDDDVEQNDLEVYGYILAGTGNPPLKIQGSLDSLFLTGQLLIKDATISSVPMQGSGYNAYEDNFTYLEGKSDSIMFVRDSTLVSDSLLIVSDEDYKKINPFERYRYRIVGDAGKQTFVNLDMNVKTEKEIYASIDFNNITRNRLFGEIKADLDIKTENNVLKAYGTVDVMGDSYFRFYRDFKLNESQVKFDGDISEPILDIRGVYASQKNTEQYGSTTTNEVEVVVTVTGTASQPQMDLKLYQDGSEISGSDAQSDAITYLLFGRYKSELSASERSAVASTLGASVGSLYASSYLSQTIREILPFIVDAQFNYTEGNVQNTDVELISDVGDARVKFGGKLLKDVKNFEIVVDYPLNKLLNLNLPETLLLEFAREEKKQALSTNQNDILTTEIKILYKIKF